MKRTVAVLLGGLALVIICPQWSSAQPAGPGEGFLVVVLLETRLQLDRIDADLESVNVDLKTNQTVIDEAERKLANAIETHNHLAKTAPMNDLQSAHQVRDRLSKARSRLEKARARAEGAYRTVREMLISRPSWETGPGIAGMIVFSSGGAEVMGKDGRKTAVKAGRPAFLAVGDVLTTGRSGLVEVHLLDGRAAVQLAGRTRVRIEEETPRGQALRILQGRAYVEICGTDDLEGALRDALGRPDEALNAVLSRYQDATGPGLARLSGRSLQVLVPAAVCAVNGTRLSVEVRDNGSAEIAMLAGAAEVSGPKGGKAVPVEENSVAVVTADGISGPRPVGGIDRWWEK